jgi:ATP-dependent DNA helicase RecG
LIIERGKVITTNPNRPHGFGVLNPETSTPYAKNPLLGAFFREIDRADELGSGMRKMMLYGKKYGGADPQLIEGDIFTMIISVPDFDTLSQVGTKSVPSQSKDASQLGENEDHAVLCNGTMTDYDGLSSDQLKILRHCLDATGIKDLLLVVDRTNRSKFRDHVLKPLIERGWLEMTIPDKPKNNKQKYRTTAEGKRALNVPRQSC